MNTKDKVVLARLEVTSATDPATFFTKLIGEKLKPGSSKLDENFKPIKNAEDIFTKKIVGELVKICAAISKVEGKFIKVSRDSVECAANDMPQKNFNSLVKILGMKVVTKKDRKGAEYESAVKTLKIDEFTLNLEFDYFAGKGFQAPITKKGFHGVIYIYDED